MTVTAPDVAQLSGLARSEAPGLAEEEYARFAALLSRVGDDQWTLPTDCAGWTVRDLAGHLVGAMRAAAALRETLRQQLAVARRLRASGGTDVDHMTAVQIERVAASTTDELVAECRRLVAPAARGRRRTPGLIRRVRITQVVNGQPERWPVGYLVDTILTRDTWMHRVDLARALGTTPVVDAGHDGRIVADVVEEWGCRHGRPYQLTLTGPAGGGFEQGAGGEALELDAVEFCRILSGRASGDGLLRTAVPF